MLSSSHHSIRITTKLHNNHRWESPEVYLKSPTTGDLQLAPSILVERAEMQKGMGSHLEVEHQERYLGCRGPSGGARGPIPTAGSQPRVLMLGREVSMTSACENQLRLWLNETESSRSPRSSS